MIVEFLLGVAIGFIILLAWKGIERQKQIEELKHLTNGLQRTQTKMVEWQGLATKAIEQLESRTEKMLNELYR